MRDYAKAGGRKGMPGYRTSSVFKYKSSLMIRKLKVYKVFKTENEECGIMRKLEAKN